MIHPAKTSKLAVLSLVVSVAWYMVLAVVLTLFFTTPQPAPQRWDALLYAIILFWVWVVTLLVSMSTGLAVLYRSRERPRWAADRVLAISGMMLAILPGGLLAWFLF
jgi:hypothetical protein